MSQLPGQLIDDGGATLYLVANESLWIGAVKRVALRKEPGRELRLVEVPHLSDVPPAERAGCQLIFVEATRSQVAEIVAWLTARRPLAAAFHVVVMIFRAEPDFSAVELGSAVQWLREAGASHVVTTVWELPEVYDAMRRLVHASHKADPWACLPLPLEAEGWQPHRRGDRF